MRKIIFIILIILMLGTIIYAVDVPEKVRLKLTDGTIKTLSMDEYLYGVVRAEMGLKYKIDGEDDYREIEIEALKAQAVASRSYATYQMQKTKESEYDLVASTSNQVYTSNSPEEIVKKAVDETTGQILTYKDQIVCAYFYSASGGHTETPENVWSGTFGYLKGVEDKYEPNIKNCSTWTAKLSSEKMKTILESKGIYIGEIKEIKVTERSENDRVTVLTIIGTNGEKILTKNTIRMTLGVSLIRSQWFELTYNDDEDVYVFEGKGYGHGIGMSQYGAIGMASAGFKYDEILKHYYTDVEIYPEVKEIKEEKEEKEEKEKEETKPLLSIILKIIGSKNGGDSK